MSAPSNPATRRPPDWACTIGALLVAAAGCSDLGSMSPGTGGSGAAGGAGSGGQVGSGGGPTTNEPVPLFMRTFAYSNGEALDGVRICVADTDNCELSNADGESIINLPANEELALTFEKEGYALLLEADVTDETFTGFGTEMLYTHEEIAAEAEALGIDYPLQGGIVRLARRDFAIEGVTFHPAGASVAAIEDNAFYYDTETQRYGWESDATTGAGNTALLPFAEGGFVEVPPGVHEFEFQNAGDCIEPSWGWAGSAPNRVRLPVREGYIVYGSLRCE